MRLAVLLSFGCLAGCFEEVPDVAVDQAELVGGIATTARPEIGTFYNGAGGGCTSTLIAPQLAIAASHCLSPMYTATAPVAGAVFQFTDFGGVFRTYAVDRVQSFATQRFEYVPAGTFTTDLALLHLASAVPTSQAIPADLALQEPTIGALSTIFGFGCTDRTPASGGGFKQYKQFNFGTPTTALCWGDSGGPVLFGALGDGGAVYGVNSDFNFVGGTDDWTDIFAAVPFYRKQIEDILHAWDGANEVGWNRPGMDYTNFLTVNVADCRFYCENDGRCEAFTWVPEAPYGRCWLKSGAPEPFLAWNNAIVSGVPTKYETGYNRAGGDYASFAPAEARPELCAAACGRDHACKSWTYVAPSGSGTGTCWLKNTVPVQSACSVCTSGVTQRRLEVGYDRPGYDFAWRSTSGADACADQCAQDDRCEAYTYTGAAGTNCFLKDAVPWAGAAPSMTSGVRGGLETNTNRWGGDYRSFTTSRLTPTTCQATCAQEAACQSWTYVPPTAPATAATCWLKSSIPSRSYAIGLVSGVKGFEMLH